MKRRQTGRFIVVIDSEVLASVRRCLDDLAGRYVSQTGAVVTHSGFVIASLLELLAVQNVHDRASLDPGYTSITTWSRVDNRFLLDCFNDVAHLVRTDLRGGRIQA